MYKDVNKAIYTLGIMVYQHAHILKPQTQYSSTRAIFYLTWAIQFQAVTSTSFISPLHPEYSYWKD